MVGDFQQRAGVGARHDGVDPALGTHDAQAVLALENVVERLVFQTRAVQTGGQISGHGGFDQQTQLSIDAAQALEGDDVVAFLQFQRARLLCRGRAQSLLQHLCAHGQSLAGHFIGEAEHGGDEVLVAFACGHKCALTTDLVDQAAADQIGQRLAHHDA